MMALSIFSQLNDRASIRQSPLSVAAIRHDLGVSRERMARVLDVSSRTVARWEDQQQLPSNRWLVQVLVQLQNIVDLGLESLTREGLHIFMTSPQPVFGNRSGIELVEAGEAETVYGELASLYEGYLGL
ncbi:MAG: transcriptional regulator [Chloroflexia bacterium]|nr:transcriptional regulator [Chloroflexia bacterium]